VHAAPGLMHLPASQAHPSTAGHLLRHNARPGRTHLLTSRRRELLLLLLCAAVPERHAARYTTCHATLDDYGAAAVPCGVRCASKLVGGLVGGCDQLRATFASVWCWLP
jgi:hypothetical protein